MKRFDAQACIKRLGLEDGGSVQKAVDQSILDVCEPYTPMDLSSGADGGELVRSAIMHTVIGSGEIVWRTPYAHYVYEGKVYVDPITHAAGFMTEDGWRSRKNVSKIPTDRNLNYQGAPKRGAHWITRAMQDGGIKKVEDAARKAIRK